MRDMVYYILLNLTTCIIYNTWTCTCQANKFLAELDFWKYRTKIECSLRCKMSVKEEKNNKQKDSVKTKTTKRVVDSLESKNIRHQKHYYKYRKMDMQQEELWAEWQEYYR